MSEETQSAPEIYDSLPYYDNDLQELPHLRQLVEKEFARIPKPPTELHPKVPPAPSLFQNNPLLAAELSRIERHETLNAIDTARYQLPAPLTKDAPEEDWQKALDNSKAQLEHQKIRSANNSLLQNYGANAWRVHNYLLEADVKLLEGQAEKMKDQVTDVNRERKNLQTHIGKQLTSLERKWTDLIANVLQIELANSAIQGEIQDMQLREAELAELVGEPASAT